MKKIKKAISLLLAVLMISSMFFCAGVTGFAADSDILEYLTYEINDGEVIITDCDSSISGEVVIPDTIEGYPVTAIDRYAFFDCELLTKITIPYSVTSIANNAIVNCIAIESITVDADNQYYSSEDGVLFNKDKTILYRYPEDSTETSYTVPEGVLTVGDSAFAHCRHLETVIIADSVTKIDECAFSMYDSSTNLKTVVLGENVSYIGNDAFYDCRALESINLPDKLTYIGEHAFEGCGIKNIDLPNGITTIGFCAFAGCDFENITIPESVTTIGDSAFAYCYDLTEIIVAENNKYYSSDAYGVLFDKNKTELLQYPVGNERTEYSIPDGVSRISSDSSFNDNGDCKLKKITIPDSLWNVGYFPFQCANLESIFVDENNDWYSSNDGVLFNKDKTELVRYPIGNDRTTYTVPDGVTAIGNYAFDSAVNIEQVTIPFSVSSIGYYAFQSCLNLNRITIFNPECSIYDGWGTFWSGEIYGYPNSTAQIYAENYNQPFVSLCDNHSLSTDVTAPTCTTQGYTTYSCAECGVTYNGNFVKANAHTDDDSDGNCDICATSIFYVINANETITVDIISEEVTLVKFVPYTTAVYTFYSESNSDTYGFLFDSDMNELTRNDDDGEGNNFFIEYELIEGETYYFGCRYYSTESSGSFNVTLKSEVVDEPPVEEENPIIGYLTYQINDGEVIITGCDRSISGDIVIPDTIEGYPVTAIGDEAFLNCYMVKSIEIPNSVKTIGRGAFSFCYELESIIIPDGVSAIDDFAFNSCEKLENISIPSSVKTIGKSAFVYCYNLSGFVVDENNEQYTNDAYGVLFNKDKTMLIQYPIGNKLSEYTIPEGVINIVDWAFAASEIANVIIPDSVVTIGEQAFAYCKSLTSIKIPVGVETIGQNAFEICSVLSNITVDEQNSNYSSDNYGVLFNKDKTMLVQYPIGNSRNSYNIPDSVTLINDYAFYKSSNLAEVSIPEGVVTIDFAAFSGCENLTDIKLPDSLIEIGGYAFESCTSLTDIKIPDGVTTLDNCAFIGCKNLKEVVISDSVTELNYNVFSVCKSLQKVFAPGVEFVGSDVFSYCTSLDMFVTFADNVTIEAGSFSESENLIIFVNKTADLSVSDNYNVVSCNLSDGVLSFSGNYKSDLYYLFDLVAVMCTYYDGIDYLFFDSFEAVSADGGHIYYYTDNWEMKKFDGTRVRNVRFRVDAFDSTGEMRQFSFNELCDAVMSGEVTNFYLIIEEADGFDNGDVEITLVEQIRQVVARVLKAIVNLLNKLFSIFK